jgi:hypothetical protein
MIADNEITKTERHFPYKKLLSTEYMQKYRYSYFEMPKRGFQRGARNYYNLLRYIEEINEFNEQHARSFVKRLTTESKDWSNGEAIFSEIIVYRYYIRLVSEGLIKGIHKINNECDIIIENLDGEKSYLEVFCIMPNLKISKSPDEIVVNSIMTHTQNAVSSIRQKLLRKIDKQKQFSKQRNNYAVIELNDISIAGNFSILSSLSDGYKVTINKETMEQVSSGFDWSNSVFDDESTKYLKGIIYFDLGDYESRTIIHNPNFENE